MIRSPWRRRAELAPLVDVHHNGSGVVPRTLTAAEKDWVAALPAGMPAAWVPEYQRVARKAHQLGRDYGRASATIHALRGEAALLRERIGELLIDVDDAKSQLDYSRSERDKLADALDVRRPPIRSGELAAQDVAVLDAEADRRIAWDELKPGDPAPPAQTDGLECMAPVTSARSGLTLSCSRTDGHAGQHVACGMDTVYGVAPADAVVLAGWRPPVTSDEHTGAPA